MPTPATRATGEPRVLVWHVHGSWTGSFVRGGHTYLLPTLEEGGPWGRGRCGRAWPDSAVEVPAPRLRDTDVDLVVLQRPEELELAERWLGRRPGRDVPAVYVEHNTPREHAATTRHPVADRDDIVLVHVTHFNELMWDNGRAPTVVIPHGIADPGYAYTGELERAAVLINEPVRRGRIVGTDLLPVFAEAAPIDLYGMGLDGLDLDRVTPVGDLDQDALHREMARRRVYVHTARWTSLGLSLLEAMHLGLPPVALACTEAAMAVPPEAGVVSTDVAALTSAVRTLIAEPERAVHMGKSAREHALAHYGLEPFLRNWDVLLDGVLS
ncbi:glycosyltransferase [Qaidamihabitans albus]|uniref:glycosyltransferase n=1 Tax=Qaidamihabitans albus TaxID=2795733 RepID=UPI0018F25155|nr:glycosyltransferase [Qaidamihabitans albus]